MQFYSLLGSRTTSPGRNCLQKTICPVSPPKMRDDAVVSENLNTIKTSGNRGILKGVWVQGLGSPIFRVVTPRVFHVTPGPLRKPLKLLAPSTGRKRHFFHYTETLPSFLAFISGDRISDFQQTATGNLPRGENWNEDAFGSPISELLSGQKSKSLDSFCPSLKKHQFVEDSCQHLFLAELCALLLGWQVFWWGLVGIDSENQGICTCEQSKPWLVGLYSRHSTNQLYGDYFISHL